jgi:uncharacterized Ntn-hydrolase superfamily protein
MTFSIVASAGTSWGVAVASKFLAVGSAVPAAAADAGAIATQSYANLAYRPDGLRHLRDGKSAQETLDALTADDDEREQRQAGIVDTEGNAATYTGTGCHDWAGGRTGPSYAIQGNILTGPDVVEAMERAWLATDAAQSLARRLYAALVAGDKAGGDRRGRQSAAILVASTSGGYADSTDIVVDLRVDDSPAPIPELGRLLDLHDLYFGKADPDEALPLEGDLADEVRRRLAALGHAVAGDGGDELDAALDDWAGVENFEERMLAGKIDPTVLEQLRRLSRALPPTRHP